MLLDILIRMLWAFLDHSVLPFTRQLPVDFPCWQPVAAIICTHLPQTKLLAYSQSSAPAHRVLPTVAYRDWNPASDTHLPKNYNITNFKEGKRACKLALQEELGLPVNPDIPLIAFIGRLDYQKGADIVLQASGPC